MRAAMISFPLAAALLAGASAYAAPRDRERDASRQPNAPSTATEPIVVSVYTAPAMLSDTVTRMLSETDDIWMSSGIRFLWQRSAAGAAPSSEPERYPRSTLSVTVDNATGERTGDWVTPLGWIRFSRPGEPDREIHVSYGNALALFAASRIVEGRVESMPVLQRETYLARAMGRALAHELGHYLLASATHTERGLMQAQRSAAELFAARRARFEIDSTEQQLIALRLAGSMLARRSTEEGRSLSGP
jgi:hypothetical protein